METHYQKEKYLNENSEEKDLKNLDSHLPEWVKRFVELYTSDIKYKILKKDSN